jgi:hypothetical protein
MPAIWNNDPKDWALDDVFDGSELNAELRDRLLYLFNRPVAYSRVTYGVATDLYPSLVGWTPLATFDVVITTESGKLEYDFTMPLLPSTNAARAINLDVYFVEANVWLSSGTSSQLTDGTTHSRVATNTAVLNPRVHGIVELAAGTYTARLYMKGTVVGINTLPNMLYQPTVKEI